MRLRLGALQSRVSVDWLDALHVDAFDLHLDADPLGALDDGPALRAEALADRARCDQFVHFARLLGAIGDQLGAAFERHIAHTVLDPQAHARVAAEVALFQEIASRSGR